MNFSISQLVSSFTSTGSKLTAERKITLALAFLLLVFLFCAVRGWLQEHDANLRATEQARMAQAVSAEKEKAISQRDALLRQYQADIAHQQAAVTSAPAAIKIIERYIPASSPQIVVNKKDIAPSLQPELPDAPRYTLQTEQQSIATARALLACDSDRAALSTCRADMQDTLVRLSASQQAEQGWKTAAQTGTRWHRFWGTVKYVGIGAAAGATLGYLSQR